MKTLLTALVAVAQGLGKALIEWLAGLKTKREAANAGALRGQVESVGRAQDLEARVRTHATATRIPADPRPGDRHVTPDGVLEVWTGSAWVLVGDEEFFNDEGYR